MLCLAALVMVALVLGFRALQNATPVETTTKAPIDQPLEPVATPTPLAQRRPKAVDAVARLDTQHTGECEVKIIGHGNALKSAVVAILDGKSGAHLATKQLGGGKLPIELTFSDIPDGEHWAVLARDASELRFAYLSRARLKPHPHIRDRRTAALRGQVYDLLVQLQKDDPDALCHCVPVLLRRPGDPDWRYRQHMQEPQEPREPREPDARWLLLTDQNGRIRLSQLGAGRYLLHAEDFERTDNAPAWQPIRVDQDREVRITGAAR